MNSLLNIVLKTATNPNENNSFASVLLQPQKLQTLGLDEPGGGGFKKLRSFRRKKP
ncbi:MAG: hypothetical protein WKF92_15835 [Pyrinomonadaceae bacterium]